MLNGAKLLLLSDDEIMRAGLRLVLADKGLAASVLTEIPAQSDETGEGTLVLIYATSVSYGLATCSNVRERMPNVKIALVGSARDGADARRAFAAGADGLIAPDVTPEALVYYLQLIALGENVLPSALVIPFAATAMEEPVNMAGPMPEKSNLSNREAEVLRHLTAGEANKVIALKLGISEATVKIHVKSLLRKLHVQNRTQAAIWADHNGLGHDAAPNVVPFTSSANHAAASERNSLSTESSPASPCAC